MLAEDLVLRFLYNYLYYLKAVCRWAEVASLDAVGFRNMLHYY